MGSVDFSRRSGAIPNYAWIALSFFGSLTLRDDCIKRLVPLPFSGGRWCRAKSKYTTRCP